MFDKHAPAPSLEITSATVTAVGGRRANEDALASIVTPYGSCYVVSDGAGGHRGGGIASRLAVDAVLEEANRSQQFAAGVLDRCFALAERNISSRKAEDASI